MLAIARALVQNQALILMNEPSKGLSPLLIQEVGEIIRVLNAEGCSILIVEQNVGFATSVSQMLCVMNKGAIVWSGPSGEVASDPSFRRFLGVNATAADEGS